MEQRTSDLGEELRPIAPDVLADVVEVEDELWRHDLLRSGGMRAGEEPECPVGINAAADQGGVGIRQ